MMDYNGTSTTAWESVKPFSKFCFPSLSSIICQHSTQIGPELLVDQGLQDLQLPEPPEKDPWCMSMYELYIIRGIIYVTMYIYVILY